MIVNSLGHQLNNITASHKAKKSKNARPSTTCDVLRPDSRYSRKSMFKKLEVKHGNENMEYDIPINNWGSDDGVCHEYVPDFWKKMKDAAY